MFYEKNIIYLTLSEKKNCFKKLFYETCDTVSSVSENITEEN